MYLKKLYTQNRSWFVVVLVFASGQLFIDYKNGIEVSPLYHYGMFSIPFHFASTYDCIEVSVNGKQLQTKNFTPNGWDNIVIPITQYNHQQEWNSNMYNQTIRRLLHINDSTCYTNRLSQNEFDDWYHHRILDLLGIADSTTIVRYDVISYKQQNGMLVK